MYKKAENIAIERIEFPSSSGKDPKNHRALTDHPLKTNRLCLHRDRKSRGRLLWILTLEIDAVMIVQTPAMT